LVATSGAPFSPKTTDKFAPQTLHGCLHLTYICQSVVINDVPKSSGNILRGDQRAGNIIV
jgi:MinD superfamily P-loop ATPase